MEFPKPQVHTNPLLSLSTFIQQNCLRLGSELSSRLDDTKRLAATLVGRLQRPPLPPFASLSQPKPAVAATLSPDYVAKTLSGTAVYTVSNSNNEFVLISDPNGAKSIGLLCFRQEDAEAFLAQVNLPAFSFELFSFLFRKKKVLLIIFRLGYGGKSFVVRLRSFLSLLTRSDF